VERGAGRRWQPGHWSQLANERGDRPEIKPGGNCSVCSKYNFDHCLLKSVH
jgi:hypothetical protein